MLSYTRGLLLFLVLSMLWVTAAAGASIGETAPDFSIVTLDGKLLESTQFKGRNPLLVLFWASWCSSCRVELPKLAGMYPALRDQGLKVVAINVGINDSLPRARSFQRQHALNFPLAFDETFEVATAFEVRGVPTIVLIDSAGKIRYNNPLLPDDLSERVEALKPPGA